MFALLLTPFLLFAQAKGVSFETKKIVFTNGATLKVEIAQSDLQRSQGLMFRTKMSDDEGMLFIFNSEQPQMFWMKNTYIPLSIGFFNKSRKLLEVLDMAPPQGPVRDENLEQYRSRQPALYALEVPQGWFARKKIQPGATFSFKK